MLVLFSHAPQKMQFITFHTSRHNVHTKMRRRIQTQYSAYGTQLVVMGTLPSPLHASQQITLHVSPSWHGVDQRQL